MVIKGNIGIQKRLQQRCLIHGIHLIQIKTTPLRDMIEADMTENAQAWTTNKLEASKSIY
jgi:hypothetical protein